jgi:hypothetical protein
MEDGAALKTAIDPRLAPAGAVYIAAARQAKTLGYQDVLVSPAIQKGSVLAVVEDAVVSTLGSMRVEAVRQGDRVRLRFCAEMAWELARDGALRWIKGESHEHESSAARA